MPGKSWNWLPLHDSHTGQLRSCSSATAPNPSPWVLGLPFLSPLRIPCSDASSPARPQISAEATQPSCLWVFSSQPMFVSLLHTTLVQFSSSYIVSGPIHRTHFSLLWSQHPNLALAPCPLLTRSLGCRVGLVPALAGSIRRSPGVHILNRPT